MSRHTRLKGAVWTSEELQRLRDIYPAAFREDLPSLFPGRTTGAIEQLAQKLHIRHGTRRPFFPRTYGNDADGNYVTGLVDGEGSFMVSVGHRRGRWNFNPKFGVSLRIDDSAVLQWLREYFGCGRYVKHPTHTASPMASFLVCNLYDLLRCIVPHLETYPLRAKKKYDYYIWKQMLEIQAEYFRRPWPVHVRSTMQSLYAELKQGRLLKQQARLAG